MTIRPVSSGVDALSAGRAGGGTSPVGERGGFAKLFEKAVGSVNMHQAEADKAVQALAMGQTDSIHGVMLAVAKADLSFRLVLEIRNRLTEALQEVMRMQV